VKRYNALSLGYCCKDGQLYTANMLRSDFKDILQTAELSNIRFHDLRHTNATLMLRSEVPAKIVSSMLGHANIGIMLDTYPHVMTDMQKSAVGVVDNLLKNAYQTDVRQTAKCACKHAERRQRKKPCNHLVARLFGGDGEIRTLIFCCVINAFSCVYDALTKHDNIFRYIKLNHHEVVLSFKHI
jgi:hypothetical protein